jgi:hypothetical protein
LTKAKSPFLLWNAQYQMKNVKKSAGGICFGFLNDTEYESIKSDATKQAELECKNPRL